MQIPDGKNIPWKKDKKIARRKKKKQNCRSELYVLQISENWLPRDYWA